MSSIQVIFAKRTSIYYFVFYSRIALSYNAYEIKIAMWKTTVNNKKIIITLTDKLL